MFIGATTENPSFEVNSALLSRARVLVLKELQAPDVRALLEEHGGRLESQQRQLEELAERQDFAERLLAQAREKGLPPGGGPA